MQVLSSYRLLNKLICELELNAGASQPPGNRKAAAFALGCSQLLRLCMCRPAVHEPEFDGLMKLSLRGWTVGMALLEDEDDAVRCSLSLPTCSSVSRCCGNAAVGIVQRAGHYMLT
jgi:hypothetical protein